MKKAERLARAESRAARIEGYQRQELAMQAFIDECRCSMTPDQWTKYYTEAERSAGEIFHIVEALVFALAATQIPIVPRLRKALDAVISECELDRSRWKDLSKLNYDDYWKSHYGYNQ